MALREPLVLQTGLRRPVLVHHSSAIKKIRREVARLAEDADHLVMVKLQDRVGPRGLVGMAVVRLPRDGLADVLYIERVFDAVPRR